MGKIETNTPRRVASAEEAMAGDGVEADIAAAAAASGKKPTDTDQIVRFVKNINPREVIVFKDGTKFRFHSSLLVCEDPALIAKINEVADRYNIVIQ